MPIFYIIISIAITMLMLHNIHQRLNRLLLLNLIHGVIVAFCFSSLFGCTWIDASGKWKSMLLLLLTWLCVISTSIGINFSSLNADSVNWLLLDILIFHSDVWQCLFSFLIACIKQFHWLIIPSNNYSILSWIFFQPQYWKIISSTRKRKHCVLSRCACVKLKISCQRKNFWSGLD